MSKRSQRTESTGDHRAPEPMTKETRKALLREARAERRLVEREQEAVDKVERTRQGLSEAVGKLAKAQERVSRRADRLAEAEAELRLRQRERLNGPHHSTVSNPYDGGRPGESAAQRGDEKQVASPEPGQEAAIDVGLLPDGTGEQADDYDGQPGQGAAHDLGLVDEDGSDS